MWLSKLSLTNFRNYNHLQLSFPRALIILKGDNAQGKTNLLEAIFMTALTKSPRAAEESELANWDSIGDPLAVTRITALVEQEAGRIELDITMQVQMKKDLTLATSESSKRVIKKIRVNGLPKRASDVIGMIKVVMFSSDDLDIISGPPSGRRRYLDLLISQLEHAYYINLQRYNQLLPQRNRLLERIGEGKAQLSEMEYWDQEMARCGGYLTLSRKKVVEALSPHLLAILKRLTSGEEGRISYLQHTGGQPESWDLKAITKILLHSLQKNKEKEIAAGMTLYGPHRDDLAFSINVRESRAFASRGQKHTLALALRLAEVSHIKEREGEAPLILVDDIFTELDPYRRGLVLQYILELGEQSIITTTEWEKVEIPSLTRAHRFQIEKNEIIKLN